MCVLTVQRKEDGNEEKGKRRQEPRKEAQGESRNSQACQQVALGDYATLKNASSEGEERVVHTDQMGRTVTVQVAQDLWSTGYSQDIRYIKLFQTHTFALTINICSSSLED